MSVCNLYSGHTNEYIGYRTAADDERDKNPKKYIYFFLVFGCFLRPGEGGTNLI